MEQRQSKYQMKQTSPSVMERSSCEGVTCCLFQYLQKLHMQERAVEEVKLAMKPFYQKRDVNKDEYKEILRKAVQKAGCSRAVIGQEAW